MLALPLGTKQETQMALYQLYFLNDADRDVDCQERECANDR